MVKAKALRVWIAALLCEVLAVGLWSRPGWATTLHLGAWLSLLWGARQAQQPGPRARLLLASSLTLPWPLLGLVLAAGLALLPSSDPVPEPALELPTPAAATAPNLVPSRAMLTRQALETQRHLDVQSQGLAELRRLVEEGPTDPRQWAQLKGFLDNPQSDGYHLAQAQITRLIEEFSHQITDCNQAIKSDPAAEGPQQELLDCYLRVIDSGLLEPTLQGHYRELAAQRVAALLQLAPQRRELHLIQIDLFLRQGIYSQAILKGLQALEQWPEDRELWSRLFEAHFQAGRQGALAPMQQLFRLLGAMRQLQPRDPEFRDQLAFWTGAC